MKDGRFEVGDTVIGNDKASQHYGITVTGWKGKVTKINVENYALSSRESTIEVQALEGSDKGKYDVCHKYFDLYNPTLYLTIKGQKLPECCGECFAFDSSGCKFGVEPSAEQVWVCRASNCPMSEHEE